MGLYISTVVSIYLFGLIMFINFSLLSFTQLTYVKWISQIQYHIILIVGFSLMGIGFFCIALDSYFGSILGTVILTIGEAALLLRGDIEIVNALPNSPSMAFGLQRLSIGVAGIASGIIGGYLYSHFQTVNLSDFWSAVAVQVLVILPIVIYLKLKKTTYSHINGINDEA